MKLKPTQRGFQRSEFIDRYGQFCSLQESSLATEGCIWLGVDTNVEGKEILGRMHLTQKMVKDLLPHLKKFARTGHL
ncbi:Uncharacterised protein [uncultured archaeon]|nr:Uncharacterised protein [uncultured archaeon]